MEQKTGCSGLLANTESWVMKNSANTESRVMENSANTESQVTKNSANTESRVTHNLANMKSRVTENSAIRKVGLWKIWVTQKTGLCKTWGTGNWKKENVLLQAKGQLHGGAQEVLQRHNNAYCKRCVKESWPRKHVDEERDYWFNRLRPVTKPKQMWQKNG
jgi:translation elongation factor EF-Ts